MNDEEALLRAIVEAPDDLALRMVYADWCEEHGQAARAALIRGQCFLEPVLAPYREVVEYGGHSHADCRFLGASILSQEVRASVLAPLRGFAEACGLSWDGPGGCLSPSARWYQVRRGFVESLVLTGLKEGRVWAAHGAPVLARVPVLSLCLQRRWGRRGSDPAHLPADFLEGFLAVDGIGRLRELDVSRFSLGQTAASALLARGGQLRLERLHLEYRRLSRATITRLEERFGKALVLTNRGSEDDIPF